MSQTPGQPELFATIERAGVADAAWRQLCAEAAIGELSLTGQAARPASRPPG